MATAVCAIPCGFTGLPMADFSDAEPVEPADMPELERWVLPVCRA